MARYLQPKLLLNTVSRTFVHCVISSFGILLTLFTASFPNLRYPLHPMDPTSLAALRASSQKTEEQPEFKIIQTFIEQLSADTEETVDKIVEITLADVDNEESMHYFYVAASVIELARRTTPDHHERLCTFLMALKKRALNHPKTGEPLVINRGAHRVWSDLPCFAWTFNDELQAIGMFS